MGVAVAWLLVFSVLRCNGNPRTLGNGANTTKKAFAVHDVFVVPYKRHSDPTCNPREPIYQVHLWSHHNAVVPWLFAKLLSFSQKKAKRHSVFRIK